MKKLDSKDLFLVLLLMFAVFMVTGILALLCTEDKIENEPSLDACTMVKDYVWDMGTEKEKRVQLLYDSDSGYYWKRDENGTVSHLTGYEGNRKPAMDFSFSEEADGCLFENCDIGVADIYHGTVKDAYRGYTYLLEQGYHNHYTIRDGLAVDIYLEKGDKYYRFLVIPEVGQATCTVTFAEIWAKTWNAVLERGVG